MIRTLILSAMAAWCLAALQTPAQPDPAEPGPGVPLPLAEERARRVSDLRYDLHFTAPADAGMPVRGRVTLRFTLTDASRALALDFSPPGVATAHAAGREIPLSAVADHLIIRRDYLREGANELTIAFDAADASLNRNPEFMYTLFVPARARFAGIPYPFGKFDFLLVPSFQFGGMEHAGAIFYNASGLLLDESATEN